MRRRLAVLLAAAPLLLAPVAASAHAILLDSDPAEGATLAAGKAMLRMRFNSRIDAARSRISLRGPGGRESVLHMTADRLGDRLSGTADLTPGAWVLHWQVLAVDGHITRGEVRFAVAPGR